MTPTLAPDELDLSGTRVLVVEDDYFIATELCNTLSRRGATIVGPAADVAEATALVRSEPIDIAVLDINLHGELVFDLARELRRRGTTSILATGYDPGVLPEDLVSLSYLEKPVNLADLVHTVSLLRPSRLVQHSDNAEEPIP